MPSVSVIINGKSYRMACDEGQEMHLEHLAKTLDGYVDQLKGSFGDIGDQRLTVMAGVMVTDEMLELKKKLEKLEQEVSELKSVRDQQMADQLSGNDMLAEQLEAAAKKIEKISAKLAN